MCRQLQPQGLNKTFRRPGRGTTCHNLKERSGLINHVRGCVVCLSGAPFFFLLLAKYSARASSTATVSCSWPGDVPRHTLRRDCQPGTEHNLTHALSTHAVKVHSVQTPRPTTGMYFYESAWLDILVAMTCSNHEGRNCSPYRLHDVCLIPWLQTSVTL